MPDEEEAQVPRPDPVEQIANALGFGPGEEGTWAADVSRPTVESHVIPVADAFKAAAKKSRGD